MTETTERQMTIPVGIVVRRAPGASRWAKWSWRVTAVLPGAAPADWVELRREGEAVEYHAGTLPLELHRSDTDEYVEALMGTPPAVFVKMAVPQGASEPRQVTLVSISANPYLANDYVDSGDMVVERIPMPPVLRATIQEFVDRHHVAEPFIKRKRDKHRGDGKPGGRGDPRVSGTTDVYRAPQSRRRSE